MTADLEVRRARTDELDAVIELCGTALGWEPGRPHRDLFTWKHHDNPFGSSPVWVAATGDGTLAGVRVFLRWELVAPGGAVHAVVRAVDTATHPDHQGRGVFRRLTMGAVAELADEGVSFVFNTPNAQSRPGYLQMGWSDVDRLPVAVAVRSPAALLRLAKARVPADKWSLDVELGQPAGEALGPANAAAITGLLATQPVPTRWRTRRTPELYAWRYRHPALHYRVLPADDAAGVGAGFVVFRVRRRGAATEGTVCDIVVPGADPTLRRRVLRRLRRDSRAAGVDYLLGLGGGDPRCGWLPLPGQGPRLTVRPLAADPPASLDRWDLAMGDVELF